MTDSKSLLKNGWSIKKLGDVLIFGNGKTRPKSIGSYPIYGGNGILGYTDHTNYGDETIVIGRVGAYCGSVYFENRQIWISDNAIAAKTKDNNNPIFLYYLLKNLDLNQFALGSSHPLITQTLLNSIDIEICNEPGEQKAIAGVLSSLDDKIDLLLRQNKTLETMAETLFRQWFVEEAKEEWEECVLAEFADNRRESIKPSQFHFDDKYVGLEHIDRRNISLNQYGFAYDVTSNKLCFEKSDILFGKLRPYFHKVCFAPFRGICSTDILVIIPKRLDYLSFCLFAFFQSDVIEYANYCSEGTRMPRTNWESLSQYTIARPPEILIVKFNEFVLSFINKIERNLNQIHTLEKMRDTLLPKLMSGEIRLNYDFDD